MEWKAGDVVMLRSGSPAMTVNGHDVDNGHVLCVLFNTVAGTFEEKKFDSAALRGATGGPETPPDVERMRRTGLA